RNCPTVWRSPSVESPCSRSRRAAARSRATSCLVLPYKLLRLPSASTYRASHRSSPSRLRMLPSLLPRLPAISLPCFLHHNQVFEELVQCRGRKQTSIAYLDAHDLLAREQPVEKTAPHAQRLACLLNGQQQFG